MSKSWFVGIIAAIVILGGGLYLVNHKNKTSNNNSTNQTTNTTSSSSSSTSVKSVPEDLTFSGAINGHMTSGHKGNTYVCAPATTGPIVGSVGGTDYTFEYRSLGASNPGNYMAYVQIGTLDQKTYWGADNTPLTLNADKRSGSVQGDLHNLSNNAEVVHISGSWTCPPDF